MVICYSEIVRPEVWLHGPLALTPKWICGLRKFPGVGNLNWVSLWCQVAPGSMESFVIVFPFPVFHPVPDLRNGQEQGGIQTFGSQAPLRASMFALLVGFAGREKSSLTRLR